MSTIDLENTVQDFHSKLCDFGHFKKNFVTYICMYIFFLKKEKIKWESKVNLERLTEKMKLDHVINDLKKTFWTQINPSTLESNETKPYVIECIIRLILNK